MVDCGRIMGQSLVVCIFDEALTCTKANRKCHYQQNNVQRAPKSRARRGKTTPRREPFSSMDRIRFWNSLGQKRMQKALHPDSATFPSPRLATSPQQLPTNRLNSLDSCTSSWISNWTPVPDDSCWAQPPSRSNMSSRNGWHSDRRHKRARPPSGENLVALELDHLMEDAHGEE